MTTKRLILLAGLHKTGTTSIQKTCGEHASLLESSGYLYPLLRLKVGNAGSEPENHSMLVGAMFRRRLGRGKPPNGYRQAVRDGFDGFLRARKPGNLVLAAEQVSTLEPEDLSDLRDWFASREFHVDVFCCVRSVASWLPSMIAQRVIGMYGPRLPLDDVAREFVAANGIVRPRMDALASVFPATRFFSFDAAIRHPQGPFGYFMALAGVPGLEGIRPVKANLGKSDHAVRLNSLVNESLGPRDRNRRTYHDLFGRYRALQSVPGEKFMLREHEVAPLLPAVLSENAWLEERFGAGFADQRIGFPPEPVLLDDETRRFLVSNFMAVDTPIRKIVEAYLAAH
jgi:hypothetical protein